MCFALGAECVTLTSELCRNPEEAVGGTAALTPSPLLVSPPQHRRPATVAGEERGGRKEVG